MLFKPYAGDFPFSLEFGQSYNGILGLGNTKHNGLDVALPVGTEILSPGNGDVLEVNTCDSCSDYGKYVKIQIGKVWVYLSHLDDVDVKVGDRLGTGQVIGRSGRTGRSTGPHLDIRVHDLDKENPEFKDYQNPREYIAFDVVAAPSPEPPAQNTSPDGPKEVRTYRVQSGDSLWRIARKFYGSGAQWPRIFAANRDKIEKANLIYPDREFIIPE